MNEQASYSFRVLSAEEIAATLQSSKEFTRLPTETQESILGLYSLAVIGHFTFPGVLSSMRQYGDAMAEGKNQMEAALQERQEADPEGLWSIGYLVLLDPDHFDKDKFVRTAFMKMNQTLEPLDETFDPTVIYGLKGVSGTLIDLFVSSFRRVPTVGEYFGRNLDTQRSDDLTTALLSLARMLQAPPQDTPTKPTFSRGGRAIPPSTASS